jgi:FKBP-type peptidyl-prolyl cis-trans isomerase SlyD
MEITKDIFVIIEYTVRLVDGSYVKGESGPASLNFIVDYNQVLPALERRLLGLREGDQVKFIIPAKEAFGEHDPNQVRERSFADFTEGRHLRVGRWVVATHPQTQAQYSYYVQDKSETGVTLDFNHPLAGKDLYYEVKIVKTRPALDEELEYLRPCEHDEEATDSEKAAVH